jgi:hypothetical protein
MEKVKPTKEELKKIVDSKMKALKDNKIINKKL